MAINKIDAGTTIKKYREAIATKLLFPGMNLAQIDKEIAFVEELTSRGQGYQIKFNSYDEVQRYVRAMGMLDYYVKKFPKKIKGIPTFKDLVEKLQICKTSQYSGYVSKNFVLHAQYKVQEALKVIPLPLRSNSSGFVKSLFDPKREYVAYLNPAISRVEALVAKLRKENHDKEPKLIGNLYLELDKYKTPFLPDDLRAIGVIFNEAHVITAPKAEDKITEEEVEKLVMSTIIAATPSLRKGTDPASQKARIEAEEKANAIAESLAEKESSSLTPDQMSENIMKEMQAKFSQNPNGALNQLQRAGQIAEELTTLNKQRQQLLAQP